MVTTSIADVAAGSIVIEDYSAVVDHCMKIVGHGETVPEQAPKVDFSPWERRRPAGNAYRQPRH